MSDGDSRTKSILLIYFPMLIAVLSLLTSIFNGYLNSRFVDLVQANVGRVSAMNSCKEVIEAYFQVKAKAGLIASSGGATPALQSEAASAVAHFAALGTYLANLRDEETRRRYTRLSQELEKIVDNAGKLTPSDLAKAFEPADKLFTTMNDDCISSAKTSPI